MANAVYRKGIERILDGTVGDFTAAGALECRAYTSSYTPNFGTDESVATMGLGVADSAALTGVSVTNGRFDCDTITFSSVAGGSTITQLVIHDVSSNVPIVYIDTDSVGALSVVTNGGDLQFQIPVAGICDFIPQS